MADIDLPTFLPSVGVLGLLVYLVIHMMRQASGDRGGYQQAIKDFREDHAAEIKEMSARHDAQITDLRTEIGILRAEVTDLKAQIEDERKARHAAENDVARWQREAILRDSQAGESDEPDTT